MCPSWRAAAWAERVKRVKAGARGDSGDRSRRVGVSPLSSTRELLQLYAEPVSFGKLRRSKTSSEGWDRARAPARLFR